MYLIIRTNDGKKHIKSGAQDIEYDEDNNKVSWTRLEEIYDENNEFLHFKAVTHEITEVSSLDVYSDMFDGNLY
jgi:hypothetical protein